MIEPPVMVPDNRTDLSSICSLDYSSSHVNTGVLGADR